MNIILLCGCCTSGELYIRIVSPSSSSGFLNIKYYYFVQLRVRRSSEDILVFLGRTIRCFFDEHFKLTTLPIGVQ